jgi:hypothetical protein
MNEQTKKIEQPEQEVKPAELSEQELDKVAGGAVTPSQTNRAIHQNGVGT